MKKITIKISKKEFTLIYNYCEISQNYINQLEPEFHSISNQLLSEIYQQMKFLVPKWDLYSDYREDIKFHLRVSEARSLALELMNYCPNHSYQIIIDKLDKSLNNHNCNLKSLVSNGTQNQVFC